MPTRTDRTLFGAELKRWRHHRRLSQLDLASRAAISQRHLSFLETGRSRPSSEMVEHLALVLDVPLRERNALLGAAGFAPAFSEEPLDGPALAVVRRHLEQLVEAHRPFPAYVIDRCWNLQIANEAALAVTALLLPADAIDRLGGNLLRLFLHPDGARRRVVNWSQAAAVLVARLIAESDAHPTDAALRDLRDEVCGYPGVAELRSEVARPSETQLLTEVHVVADAVELRLWTTITSFGAAADVTLDELRLETLLPADEATGEALRTLGSAH